MLEVSISSKIAEVTAAGLLFASTLFNSPETGINLKDNRLSYRPLTPPVFSPSRSIVTTLSLTGLAGIVLIDAAEAHRDPKQLVVSF